MNCIKKALLICSLGLFWLTACAPNPTASENFSNTGNTSSETLKPVPKKDRTFLAIYMVGSDLEDDISPRNGKSDENESGKKSYVGAGTDDFIEMIKGFETLSKQQQQNLDVLVGFGGARKAGWKGIKYTDMACIIKDSKDNYFGNDSCYSTIDPEANMANQDTLQNFIVHTMQQSQGYGKKILDIWDHGVAYQGVGHDTNAGKHDLITLEEMEEAFSEADAKFDLIGFDACLMGNLEVAKRVKPYANYMVASEELEPGHGWNYSDIIHYLAQYPKASLIDIGKKLVDSFFDTPNHQKRKNKTLSLIDLKKIDQVVSEFDNFVSSLDIEQFPSLLMSLKKTQKFGVQSKRGIEFGMDTIHWVENIQKSQNKFQAQPIDSGIQQALKEAIIYARHDKSKKNANGLSIYPLNKILKQQYSSELAVSNTWYNFVNQFISKGINDKQKPLIKPSSEYGEAQDNDPFACTVDGEEGEEEGHCFEVSDNVGLKTVKQVFALKQADDKYFLLGSDELYYIDESETSTTYFMEKWDGEWFILCDGDCDDGDYVFPSAYYEEESEDGNYIYITEAELNGESVNFYLELDRKSEEVIAMWAVPYSTNDEGEVIMSKLQLDIEKGDSLTFYNLVYDPQSDEENWEEGDSITFTTDPIITYERILGKKTYYIEAEDYNDNFAFTQDYDLPPDEEDEEDDSEQDSDESEENEDEEDNSEQDSDGE